jgi:hypothetical protein
LIALEACLPPRIVRRGPRRRRRRRRSNGSMPAPKNSKKGSKKKEKAKDSRQQFLEHGRIHTHEAFKVDTALPHQLRHQVFILPLEQPSGDEWTHPISSCSSLSSQPLMEEDGDSSSSCFILKSKLPSQPVELLKIKVLHKFAVFSTVFQAVSTMFQVGFPTVFQAVK